MRSSRASDGWTSVKGLRIWHPHPTIRWGAPGSSSMDVKALSDQYIFNTYKRYPITIKKAQGSWVWDDKGKRYLDFFSGLAVSGIGHVLPPVVRALRAQAGKLMHCSNLFYSQPAALLAKELCDRSFAKKVFFCN